MGKYDPPIFFNSDQFNAQKTLNLREAEVSALEEQNKYLHDLAQAAITAATKAEKSARCSKVCTILSVVFAGLMLVTSILSIIF